MGKITVVEIILRLLASAGVGFALGIQRARSSHPAGVRTHTLVAFGSCVVMSTSCIMYYQTVSVYGATPSDPARLGAQVINGIGFLGAGAILREGFSVRGLTTAASVWMAACVGLATGMGYYALAFIATVMSLIVLLAFDGIQQRLRTRHRPEMEIQLECETMGDVMVELNRQADHLFITLLNLSFGRTQHNTYLVSFRANFPNKDFEKAQHEFLQELAAVPGILRMENHQDAS